MRTRSPGFVLVAVGGIKEFFRLEFEDGFLDLDFEDDDFVVVGLGCDLDFALRYVFLRKSGIFFFTAI